MRADHVLHLVATGPTDHMHNHLETTFANGRAVTDGPRIPGFVPRQMAGGQQPFEHAALFQPRGQDHRLAHARASRNPGRAQLDARPQPGADLRCLPAQPDRAAAKSTGHRERECQRSAGSQQRCLALVGQRRRLAKHADVARRRLGAARLRELLRHASRVIPPAPWFSSMSKPPMAWARRTTFPRAARTRAPSSRWMTARR